MATEDDIKLVQKLNSLKSDELALNKELRGLSKEQLDTLTKINGVEDEIAKKAKLLLETQRSTVDYAVARFEQTEKELEAVKKLLETEKSRYAQSIIQAEADKLSRQLREDEIELIKQQIKAGEEADLARLKHLEDLDKKLNSLADNAPDMVQGLFGGDPSKVSNSLKKIGSSIKGELTKKMKDAVLGAESFGGALKAAGSYLAILALIAYAEAAVKLAIELGNVENSFMKATGASEEFASSITETYAATRIYTVTAEDASKATQALFNTFTDFTFQNAATRKSLQRTGVMLEKLGISNEKFAQSIQVSTKGLGMSADEAGQSMIDLEKYARELGVSPERLSQQFLDASDSLQKLGENGDEAFRDLAAASKVTALEVNKLLNIVNKFDTFEGAARQAGKLNAALGGNFVNAMDLMMETDPTARFEQIRDAILDTGLSFDEMSYYQKNFYKDALGLESIGDLALSLSGNMDAVSESTKKTQGDWEDAAKRAKELASFQDQLKALFAEMVPVLSSVVKGTRSFITVLTDNAKPIKVVLGLLTILGSVLLGIGAGWTGFGAAGAGAGITLGLGLLFDSIETGTPGVSALSEIFSGIGDTLGFVWSGITDVWKAIKPLFAGFEVSQSTLEAVGTAFRVIGWILGVVLIGAIIKIVGPLTLLAIKIGLVISAIGKLGNMLFKKPFASSFLDGLGKIGSAFTGIATGALEVLNPVKMVTKLVEALGNMFTTVIESIKGFFEILADPVMADNIMNIGDAITAIPTRKNLEFVASMGAAATAGTAAAVVGGVGAAVGGAVGTVSSALGITSSGQGSPQEITINLMVDRDKLATVVHKINGKASSNAIAGRG